MAHVDLMAVGPLSKGSDAPQHILSHTQYRYICCSDREICVTTLCRHTYMHVCIQIETYISTYAYIYTHYICMYAHINIHTGAYLDFESAQINGYPKLKLTRSMMCGTLAFQA